jgi:hypothetical protein
VKLDERDGFTLLPILLNVQGPTMLAVPSTKLDWNEEQ